MTAPNGTVIAKAVPGLGGETGVVGKNGNLQVQARAFFQFLDDGKYIYLANTGIGSLVGHPFDLKYVIWIGGFCNTRTNGRLAFSQSS